MNEAERHAMLAAEERYTSNLEPSEVGYAPLDFKAGWQAALEWQKSTQTPFAWCIESTDSADWCFAKTKEGVESNSVLMDADGEITDAFPLYTSPPTAQINEQMRDALEFFVGRFEPMRNELIFSKRLAIDKAKAALEAATPK